MMRKEAGSSLDGVKGEDVQGFIIRFDGSCMRKAPLSSSEATLVLESVTGKK